MQARKAVQALAWGAKFPGPLAYSERDTPGTVVNIKRAERRSVKMELLEIAKELIANVGFPIFCVIVMFREMEQEREAHKVESAAWTEALNNNTLVMQKLLNKMEGANNVS